MDIKDRKVGRNIVFPKNTNSTSRVFSEWASKEWLKSLGLPVTETLRIRSADEAVALADKIGYPVVLKIDSPHISHKSDIGGVKLNLTTEKAVRNAFEEIMEAAKPYDPDASLTIQPMLFPLMEVIIGIHTDPQFGPVIAFGSGGVLVELLKDLSWSIIPLAREDALSMIRAIKCSSLLFGYRGKPAGDIEALIDLLVRVSEVVAKDEEVISLDLNPVLVFPEGKGIAIADARLQRGIRRREILPPIDKERLKRLFSPATVAIIGASPNKKKLGYTAIENLLRDGYQGEIYPVNPRYEYILGLKTYPALDAIPTPPDTVISGVGPEATIELIKECISCRAGGLVIYAAGFKEMGEKGETMEQSLNDVCAKTNLPCLGPNTPGFINPHLNLNLTFFPFPMRKGGFSLITQSGGVGGNIYRLAIEEGFGISKWIGVGNRCTIGFAKLIEFLHDDPETKVIGVYMEGADDAREFALKATEVTKRKPVIVYKVGRHPSSSMATLTHTGALAGSYILYKSIFRQHGILLAENAFSFISGCKALTIAPLPKGNRVGILTITGGGNVIIMDYLLSVLDCLPEFNENTVNHLKDLLGEDAPIVIHNPLDLTMHGFQAEILITAIETILSDPGIDMLLAMIPVHPHRPFPFDEVLKLQRKTGKPVILYCVVQDVLSKALQKNIEELQTGGIPVYVTPEQAGWGTLYLLEYARIHKSNS